MRYPIELTYCANHQGMVAIYDRVKVWGADDGNLVPEWLDILNELQSLGIEKRVTLTSTIVGLSPLAGGRSLLLPDTEEVWQRIFSLDRRYRPERAPVRVPTIEQLAGRYGLMSHV